MVIKMKKGNWILPRALKHINKGRHKVRINELNFDLEGEVCKYFDFEGEV